MTTIDRPLLRVLVRGNGREKTLAIIERARRSVEVSRGGVGLLFPYGDGYGYEIKASDGRMTGVITFDGTSVVKWTDGVLAIWRKRIRDVPIMALQAMPGRPVTDLIDWNVLDDRMIITGVHEDGINYRIDLENTTLPLCDAAKGVAEGHFD